VTAVFAKLRTAAEGVLALMMGVMFIAFIAQIIFRYFLNLPLAWSDEVCTIVWLWGILWGASFVMRNSEDMRFDMLYSLLPRGVRRACTVLVSVLIVVILLGSLPAAWSYVTFMKVEYTANFRIPMNWLFSIYIVFVLAMVVRHASIGWQAFKGQLVEDDGANLLVNDAAAAAAKAPAA
jgi:TRAP-type C4-dicarboxylate transport system permease small subunit